ncbi:MAG: zinc-binding dehydrogenase, partial [Cyanothece sp. SIO1E1]|nr:zinc-binding dehydrogenase [Cyanothece sp. SIO1E1]
STLPTPSGFVQGLLTVMLPGKKAKFILAKSSGHDLAELKQLIEADQLRPIIDRTYPLSELAAAHAYSEAGHAVGKIVVTI